MTPIMTKIRFCICFSKTKTNYKVALTFLRKRKKYKKVIPVRENEKYI
ncbi:17296_t:CDS:2, partial [Funneliformis caledonium]